MTAIDWDRFAERVPAGTIVITYLGKGNEGVLLENYPDQSDERDININPDGELANLLKVMTFTRGNVNNINSFNPEWLHYLIDGTWVTFEDVMKP